MEPKTTLSAAKAVTNAPAPDGPAVEIVTFRLARDAGAQDFLEAARATETTLRARGALVRRLLAADADGLWTDVIEWTSHSAALAAAEAVMAEPAFRPFLAMIDPSRCATPRSSGG